MADAADDPKTGEDTGEDSSERLPKGRDIFAADGNTPEPESEPEPIATGGDGGGGPNEPPDAEKAVGEAKKPEDGLGARWIAATSALQKAPLVLLALAALWLALLNSYARFGELRRGDDQRAASQALLKRHQDLANETRTEQARLKLASERAARPASQAEFAAQARALDDTLEALRADRKKEEEELNRRKERVAKLKDESLELSVLGTKLLARLAFAPLGLLLALFIWLSWLGSRRLAAQAVAAEHVLASASAPVALHGASMWLAPLPSSLTLQPGAGASGKVEEMQLRAAVGWRDGAARRQTAAFRMVAVVLACVVLHVVQIAFDFTDPAHRDLGIVDEASAPWLALFTVCMAGLCLVRLAVLATSADVIFDGADLPLVSPTERWALLAATALSAVAVVVWRPFTYGPFERLGRALPGGARGRGRRGEPRFIPAARLALRRQHRRTTVTLLDTKIPTPPALVWHDLRVPVGLRREAPRVAVHHVRTDRSVRLLSAVTKGPAFDVVKLDTLSNRIAKQASLPARQRLAGTDVPLINPRLTSSFESYALELLERSPRTAQDDTRRPTVAEREACSALWTGVRLAMQVDEALPVNLRLADLLAGLCVRSGQDATYLEPLRDTLRQRVQRIRESGLLETAGVRRDLRRKDSSNVRPPRQCVATSSTRQRGRSASLCREIERLESRIATWELPARGKADNAWRRRWKDRTSPRVWHDAMSIGEPVKRRQVATAGGRAASGANVAAGASAAASAPPDRPDRRAFFLRLFSRREPTPVLGQRAVPIA